MTDSDPSARPPEQQPAQPVRILAMGDLVASNGYARLLAVFAGVARWNRRARLIIVGEGPQRDALEAQVDELGLAECVGLPGRVDLPKLAEWMQRAHVFVSPGREEGKRLPSGLPVAMAGGLCVVATTSGGTERVLEDGVTGLLVDADDETALSRALHLAVSNTELRRQLGEAAAAAVRGERLRKSA